LAIYLLSRRILSYSMVMSLWTGRMRSFSPQGDLLVKSKIIRAKHGMLEIFRTQKDLIPNEPCPSKVVVRLLVHRFFHHMRDNQLE